MDQNRCLLDVIDNPQLLQSFLESESSAETISTNNQANNNNNVTPSPFTSSSTQSTTTTTPSSRSTQPPSHLASASITTTSTQPQQTFVPAFITSTAQSSPPTSVPSEITSGFGDQNTSFDGTSSSVTLSQDAATTNDKLSPPPPNPQESEPLLSNYQEYDSFDSPGRLTLQADGPGEERQLENDTPQTISIQHQNHQSHIQQQPALIQPSPFQIPDNSLPQNDASSTDPMQQSGLPTSSNYMDVDQQPSSMATLSETSQQMPNLTNQQPQTSSSLASTQLLSPSTSSQLSHEISAADQIPNPFAEPVARLNQTTTPDDKQQSPSVQITQSEPPSETDPFSDSASSQPGARTQIQLQSNATTISSLNPIQHLDTHNSQSALQEPNTSTPIQNLTQAPTNLLDKQETPQAVYTATTQPQTPTATTVSATHMSTSSSSSSSTTTTTTTSTKAGAKTNAASKAATKNTPTTPVKKTPKPRAPRGKNAKKDAAANQPASTTPNLQKPTQTIPFMTTTPGQQQILFQPNSGIRQQAILGQSPMGQAMTGVPQQQRVIQIQTANGPMYFAIAPGPAMNNPMLQNNHQQQNPPQMQQNQQQQQQQPMMQSQKQQNSFTFQPNTNVMMRPQLGHIQQQQQQQTPNQQQTRHHLPQPAQQQISGLQGGNILVNGQPQQLIQTPHTHPQPRLGAPLMAGQTIAIQSPQNSQVPSSQPMMMPRMSNQIILNRPMNSTGPLLPGQQQFIQILTPNGPMLLALPTQQAPLAQQQQSMNNTGSTNSNSSTMANNNNNSTMIDYNNQQAPHSQAQQLPLASQQHQMQTTDQVSKPTSQTSPTKTSNANSSKNSSNSKSGIDLADLLLDCGILPEDRMTSTQSPSSIKTAQSPSIQQISSPMPAMNSPLPTSIDSTTPMTPNQHTPQPTMTAAYSGQPMQQQQPIRITLGPDGQMIMQPHIYGSIRPVMTTPMGQPTHFNTVVPNNIMPSSSPMMTTSTQHLSSNPSTPNSSDNTTDNNSTTTKKTNAKGKGTAVKRSRSKKSDLDKFPILKTPKIAQQQQQQKQLQAVTVVPMTMLVGDQNKGLVRSDVKPNVGQLVSGQQVSIAKIVTPVMQAASMKQTVQSGIQIQTSIPAMGQTMNQHQLMNAVQNTQIVTAALDNSGNSINSPALVGTTTTTTSSNPATSTSQISSSSGNVTTNLLQHHRVNDKPGTVESNPHISSSLMPTTLSLSVDTQTKVEQNGLKTMTTAAFDGQKQPQTHTLKAIPTNGGQPMTIVIHHTSQAQQLQKAQQLAQQQLARQVEMRARAILNQLAADQNAAVNPQTKQAFKSVEDACKRLLRYHVFDTQTASEAQIKKVDAMFETAVKSLVRRKRAIYDKYRLLLLKQSMKTVPSSEEVMLEQVFVNDELAYIKKERELFREYEAQLESMDQSKLDSRMDSTDDPVQDYFAFGSNSPRPGIQEHSDNVNRSSDDWRLSDNWGDSRYPTVPDSEAATAIESIIDELG